MPLPRWGVGKAQGGRRQGLSVDQIEAARRAQHGLCPICWLELPPVPTLDHDHELARLHGHDPKRGCARCFRALLHNECNLVLGFAREDPDRLRRAAVYLEESRRRQSR